LEEDFHLVANSIFHFCLGVFPPFIFKAWYETLLLAEECRGSFGQGQCCLTGGEVERWRGGGIE